MLSVDVRRYGERTFRDFIKAQPGIGNLIANAIAEKYAEYLRRNYFSGQSFAVKTGETRRSVKFLKMDKIYPEGVFFVRPGIGIEGMLNYLYPFERGSRPFMKPSFASFDATGEPLKIAQRIYNAMEKKILI